jgi:hypothetical protein
MPVHEHRGRQAICPGCGDINAREEWGTLRCHTPGCKFYSAPRPEPEPKPEPAPGASASDDRQDEPKAEAAPNGHDKAPGADKLEPDAKQLGDFIEALFKYATKGTFVSLRGFEEGKASEKPFCNTPVQIGDTRAFLTNTAIQVARNCAQATSKVVFCPPVATFKDRRKAREVDLAEGVALSVECDERPGEALERLTLILGAPTIVVLSGSEWLNPATGEYEPKCHLHWRLAVPARAKIIGEKEDRSELDALKRARQLACRIVGGDPTTDPIVHPMRWPGSWHRKSEPRLCKIKSLDPNREIELGPALAKLEAACPGAKHDNSKGGGKAEGGDWTTLMQEVLSAKNYHAALNRLAAKVVKGGMTGGVAVEFLRGLMEAANGARDDRWKARYDDIPRAVRTAEEKFGGPEQSDDQDNDATEQEMLAELNEIYATVSVAGKFRVMTFGPDKEYPKQIAVTFATKSDFLNQVVHPKIKVVEKNDAGATRPIRKPRGKYWIEHPHRRQFDDIDFLPGGPAIIETRDPRKSSRIIRRHNMWSGFSVEPKEGDCSLYLAHLFDHVCRENQHAYDYLLSWMASGVQEPGNPGRACISLRGEPGAGKGITAREYGKLFGRHFAPLNQREHVIGKFNAHTAEAVLIFADEALFVGDARDADILKYLVSEEDKLLERKGIDAIRIRNYARLIVASNHDHVLRIEVHDRRYCALHVVLPDDMVGPDGADTRREYFGAIIEQMNTDGRAALLHYLLKMDISKFNPERIPQTEELDKQKLLSAPPGDQAVIALAQNAWLPGALISRPWIAYARETRYHDGILAHIAKSGGRGLQHASEPELAEILKGWGFTNKKLADGNAWKAPDLGDLRTQLKDKYPALSWDDTPEWGHVPQDERTRDCND